jgi:hypothetical protein
MFGWTEQIATDLFLAALGQPPLIPRPAVSL